MTASHTPVARDSFPRPAGARPLRTRRIAVLLLYAALAVQVAVWAVITAGTGSVTSAFTQPHPGFPAGIVAGGAVWLVQFALVVVLLHKRALSRPAR
jgi:putative copper export protein